MSKATVSVVLVVQRIWGGNASRDSNRPSGSSSGCGDTAVLAGAQSLSDGEQDAGVDRGPGYDGKRDRSSPAGEEVTVQERRRQIG
jgi:hypothetical protein